jgi:flagellar protein FliO/FliZ
MDTSSLLLGLRVLLSLAAVFGLLWYAGRRLSGTGTVRRSRSAAVSVVGRQSLGGKTGVALVEVGGRRLLLGVSEHGVNLLTEVDMPEPETGPARTERVELDPELLESVLPDALPDLLPTGVAARAASAAGPRVTPTLTPLSTPAARKPAVPKPRNPLEGSILDAATWRQAVVAVQERTLRH